LIIGISDIMIFSIFYIIFYFKSCVVGGFGGVYEENGAYRPQMSMIIHENPDDRIPIN
jgi:hypothetical protein